MRKKITIFTWLNVYFPLKTGDGDVLVTGRYTGGCKVMQEKVLSQPSKGRQ